MPEQKLKRKHDTKGVFKEYWEHTKKYPWLFGLSIAGLLIAQIANVIGPVYIGKIFDILGHIEPSQGALQQLLGLISIYTLVSLIAWAGGRMEMGLGYMLIAKVTADLTRRSFSNLIHHSYQFFTSSFSGALTRQISRFSGAYENLYYSLLTVVMGTGLYVAGILVVILSHSIILGFVIAGWILLYIGAQLILSRWQLPLRRARSKEDSNLTAALADAIANQHTVSLFSAHSYEQHLVSAAADRLRASTNKIWNLDAVVIGIQDLLSTAITVTVLWLSVRYWQQGALTVGTIVLIQLYIFGILNRVFNLGRQFRVINSAIADASETVALLQTPYAVKDKKGAKKLKVKAGEVWFDDVSFGFNDGTQVLKNFNLTIATGEKIALVGPSGAGKPTVTKLLLRLYDVKKGMIKIDEQNIAHVTQDSLREAIGFVPQEPILFHRSLMENIRYGRRSASDAEVIEAAKKAHCHEFIDKLPQKYDTFVGERGIKLSGGERQRVAIARAILKNAPLLVLDEATSSLDSESEALIQDALEVLMRGKTVVVIAHRLSTIMKMDRIVVMSAQGGPASGRQQGNIVQEGTHLELINQQGLYQKLWSIQAGGFLQDPAEAVE